MNERDRDGDRRLPKQRRLRRSAEEKLRVVLETQQPGTSVALVARTNRG